MENDFIERLDELRWEYGLDAECLPKHWQLSPDGWRHARRVDDACQQVAAYVNSGFSEPPCGFDSVLDQLLRKPIIKILPEDPWEAFRRGVRSVLGEDEEPSEPPKPYVVEIDPLGLLHNLTRLELGPVAVGWDTSRLIELAKLEIRASSERGRAYLDVLARCWVRGAEDSTITWSRSLLEAELWHALEAAGVVDDGGHKRLRDLIHLAGYHGVLGGGTFTAADDVRTFGNDILHIAPGVCDARRALTNLAKVLSALRE